MTIYFKKGKQAIVFQLSLIVLILFFFVEGVAIAETDTTFSVKGKITLPTVPPEGGTVFKLKFYNSHNAHIQYEKDIDIVFSEGDTSKPYAIELPKGENWGRSC